MIHQTLIVIILCLLEYNQALECTLIGKNCTFTGIQTSESAPHFHPHASDNQTVEIVEFTDSVMPVLTDELCKVFPNLKELWADKLSMEQIAPNALHECKHLKYVSFWTNKLQTLDANIFEMSPKLETITFQLNYLNTIDGKLFKHTKNLQRLCLAENFLSKLPLDQFPILEKLESLFIHVNDLTDLDDLELIRKFRNLKEVYIHNNLFDCARLRIILDGLRRNNVEVKEWYKHVYTRNKNLTTIENVECVTTK